MDQKVYFAGSIRGGREDAALYHDIIAYIKETDTVLTEHVGDLSKSVLEQGRSKGQSPRLTCSLSDEACEKS